MMRKILLVLSLAFAFVMLPCVSLADDGGFSGSDGGEFYQNYGLRWSGYTHDGEWTAALAKAPDPWFAAVLACGGNPALLTPEVRSKLSDPSYGGAFYTYATTFYHIMSQYEIPEWVPVYVLIAEGLSDFWHGEFGDTMLWQSEVPNILASAALVDYNKVIKGEDLGGGGSSEPGTSNPGSYLGITINAFACTRPAVNITATNATFDNGVVTTTGGITTFSPYVSSSYYVSSVRMFVPSDVVVLMNSYINQGYDVVVVSGRFIYGRNLSISFNSNFKSYVINGSSATIVQFGTDSWYADSDGIFNFGSDFSASNVTSSTLSLPDTYYYFSQVYSSPFEVPSDAPAGTWPEPVAPVTPDPPEVPTPTAPTETVDPDPTAPTITWPTAPTLVLPTAPIVVETPEGIDYTELLTLINDNLNSIDAYLQNFYSSFNSFRSDFLSGVDDIVDGLRNIYQYLGHLNNILEVHCKHITDQIEESVYNLELYLKRLFEWLPRQLDFDAQYDDSAVTALLRRILNKIPGGSGTPVTYKPNPQSDEPSFWDWLADLFNRILQKLLDLLPDEMIQLGQLFGELINLFPFSIPWDLFALLALFGHEPVTPVIDIPWGYGGSDGQVMMIRIDLHAWDGVAEMVRPVFLVLFCLQLALLSRDLLKIINVKSGGE